MGLCQNLTSLKSTINNGDGVRWNNNGDAEGIPFHQCRLKQAMGKEDPTCPHSRLSTYGPGSVDFDSGNARGCPLYTEDSGYALDLLVIAKSFGIKARSQSTRSSDLAAEPQYTSAR